MKTITALCLIMFFQLDGVFSQSGPNTINDSYTTSIDLALSVTASDGLLSNDTDPDGDAINIVGLIISGIEYVPGQTIPTIGGNVTINADGSFNYSPSLGFDGSVPVIVYIVSDGTFNSYANLYLTITREGPPEAANDIDTTDIDTTLNVPSPGVLSNDSYEDEDTIAVISFTVEGITYNAGQTATTSVGNFSLQADGSFIFVPAAGYVGEVPPITYTISDGLTSSTSALILTVENVEDLITLQNLNSCNQGFTTDGKYKIQYRLRFENESNARDYHTSSIINTIEIIKDLDEIYGPGCVIELEDFTINSPPVDDFIQNPYPIDFDNDAVNQDFLDGDSSNLFTDVSVENSVLYPRQSVSITYCLIVEPFCDGRPNPTPSGSGIDFEALVELTSSSGDDDTTLLLEDFHTTESIITAGYFIPDNTPEVNPDGTFDYINSVVLTNDGGSTANNVNFNLGLGNFLDNGLTFSILTVTQVSGPPVNINENYDGDTSPLLLLPNNNLAPGETIVLEIFHLLDPVPFTGNNIFFPVNLSQTQGILDGFDETTPENSRRHTFAVWEDNLGNHLDRYYTINSLDEVPINDQCSCRNQSMAFEFISSADAEKVITNIDSAPGGILEYEEITFQLTITNTSPVVELTNLVLQDDLSAICNVDPISFTAPEIVSSTASNDPNLNPNYDGITDIDIFDGTSGLLNTGESITVEITVLLGEECLGQNTIEFSGEDPSGTIASAIATVVVDTLSDNDNDGISDDDDIDDDNDTIPDIDEYDGLDPLDDHDSDGIPNYRDVDFSPDANNDGIVDIFDFDGDGIPNHFDLDSDNDGILDINEVNNQDVDTDNDGRTNNPVGENGLDNTVETDDSFTATITYIIPNTDTTTNPDYRDIDADGDGIVDNIEAQPTDNYLPPNNIVDDNGIDIAYPQGLVPVDTDGDGIFDYVDTNSDNDIRDDFIEGWDFDNDGTPETIASEIDVDNDGLDDAYDNDTTQVNPTNAQVPTDFPNVDYDVTLERDWREIIAVVVIINDISLVEGSEFEFTISLVAFNDNTIPVQSATPIQMTLFTTDGADTAGEFNIAISPFDYIDISDIDLVIPPFTETSSFTITSIDDNISELDELFTLNANITSDNTINTEAEGIGTILDNEPLPTITMNDDIVFEGEDLIYDISIDIPSSSPVIINIESVDVTTTANADYIPISTTFTIEETTDPANSNLEIETPFNIETLIDNLNEPDEEVLNVFGNVSSINVTNPNFTNTGTILDLDPDPLVVISDDEVIEGNTLEFTITLLNSDGEPMGNYLPIDFELETLDITTTVNLDYLYFNDFDFIPAGESSLTIQIPTLNDNLNEVNEFMNLSATIITGIVANNSNVLLGLGTIIDNDIPNLFTPNNDGQSDVFRIGNLENYPNFKLIIFDRWGGEIYNYNNNGRTSPQWWDGTKNGNPVIEGVYFYELDYNDGIKKPQTGFIQLAR